MRDTPVADIMTRDPLTITRYMGVDMALEIMGAKGVKRLPVVSQKNGSLIGIITQSDAREAWLKSRLEEGGVPLVGEGMSDYVYTAAPNDTLARAAEVMLNHDVGALPVVQDGALVGIITERDIFKFLVKAPPTPSVR